MYVLGITDNFNHVFTEKLEWKYCHIAVMITMSAVKQLEYELEISVA